MFYEEYKTVFKCQLCFWKQVLVCFLPRCPHKKFINIFIELASSYATKDFSYFNEETIYGYTSFSCNNCQGSKLNP